MKKSIIYLVLMTFIACSEAPREYIYTEISGETMGTYYRITLASPDGKPGQETIDRWLKELNQSLSTYIPTSTISSFNQSSHGLARQDIPDKKLADYFFQNLKISEVIYQESKGSFDPTVMPLVNYWGFGYDHTQPLTSIDTHKIDSLRRFVGFDLLSISDDFDSLGKPDTRIQLDFSAVAKGYAIDIISQFLEDSFSIENYLVDIGGEARARGVNREGKIWRLGINEPSEDSPFNAFRFIVQLKDQSIATSGNYRNFYEIDGQKISHTINPETGFFERNNLLSASILTKECGYADGYATACMAMGFEAAKQMVESNPDLEAIMIYLDSDNEIKHYITSRIKEFVTLSN